MVNKILTGVIVEESAELSLTELSHACATSTEWLIELVEEGVLEPPYTESIAAAFARQAVKRAP